MQDAYPLPYGSAARGALGRGVFSPLSFDSTVIDLIDCHCLSKTVPLPSASRCCALLRRSCPIAILEELPQLLPPARTRLWTLHIRSVRSHYCVLLLWPFHGPTQLSPIHQAPLRGAGRHTSLLRTLVAEPTGIPGRALPEDTAVHLTEGETPLL